MKRGNKFDKILKEIKSIEIQGASNIARAGIEAFLLNPDKQSARKIINTRPTEPLLQNAIYFLLKSKNPKITGKRFLKYIHNCQKKIAINGARLIKNNMNIFTHCHSTNVVNILIYAKKIKKKKFVVYNTETQPLLQGRKTARELAKAGIKVIHLPDLAAEEALRKCDLFLFGADAYLKRKVINKTGTNTLVRIAKEFKIPCYSCGESLKFTKKIKLEIRNGKEVWDEREKNIQVFNPAFSELKSKYVTGIVSEFGVLHYKKFVKLAKNNLKRFLW